MFNRGHRVTSTPAPSTRCQFSTLAGIVVPKTERLRNGVSIAVISQVTSKSGGDESRMSREHSPLLVHRGTNRPG